MGNTDSSDSVSFVSDVSDNDQHITHAEPRMIQSIDDIAHCHQEAYEPPLDLATNVDDQGPEYTTKSPNRCLAPEIIMATRAAANLDGPSPMYQVHSSCAAEKI